MKWRSNVSREQYRSRIQKCRDITTRFSLKIGEYAKVARFSCWNIKRRYSSRCSFVRFCSFRCLNATRIHRTHFPSSIVVRAYRRLAAYCSCREAHQPEKLFPDQICQRPNIDCWKASRTRGTTASPSFSSLSPAIDSRDLTCRDLTCCAVTVRERRRGSKILSFNMRQLSASASICAYLASRPSARFVRISL